MIELLKNGEDEKMEKKEAEELFSMEIDDCPFKVFYCSAITELYKKKEDNPGKMLVMWCEEGKCFSFVVTNHEVFVQENFISELEQLKKG